MTETTTAQADPTDNLPTVTEITPAVQDSPEQFTADQHIDEQQSAEFEAPELVRATFADLGLSESIVRAVAEKGYLHPTPIQEQAIPFILMGRDVLGTAQTGTGKTAGFTLPMLDILTGSRARARMPRSLILEPTRELALQVAENFVMYGKYQKLTHALIIGGESMSDQKDVLTRGVDVLIATPGRLIDMFERGSILLSDVKVLVIDEVDRMLDMGFIPDVERIVSLLPKNRQTLFFSATMAPEIRRLADAFLDNPKSIAASRPATVATTIVEGLARVDELDKREALRRLIRTENVQNALIFCNRKVDVDILYKSLNRHKFSVGALHGDMAQPVRFATLEKFKAGELKLLVCSDVAARGLDIGGLSHVFNFDVPHHAEDYIHRIGRTGRAGLEGHAFTIATPNDQRDVQAIEKLTGHAIPVMPVEGFETLDWAPDDGRKRGRGRGGAKPAAPRGKAPARTRAPARAKTADEATAAILEAGVPVDAAPVPDAPVARRARAPRKPRPAAETAVAVIDAPQPPTQAPAPADDQPYEHRPREDRIREDRPRAAPMRDKRAQEERPRHAGESRRPDRYRRDDDLGPSVTGFGDEIPAFMRLPTRAARAAPEVPDTDFNSASPV